MQFDDAKSLQAEIKPQLRDGFKAIYGYPMFHENESFVQIERTDSGTFEPVKRLRSRRAWFRFASTTVGRSVMATESSLRFKDLPALDLITDDLAQCPRCRRYFKRWHLTHPIQSHLAGHRNYTLAHICDDRWPAWRERNLRISLDLEDWETLRGLMG